MSLAFGGELLSSHRLSSTLINIDESLTARERCVRA